MTSSSCEAKKTIEFLKLLNENIVHSACFEEEVIETAKYLQKYIKNVIVENISSAIIEKKFVANTEPLQTALEVYNYDPEIFTEVFDKVFEKISKKTTGERILSSLANFQDIGPAISAYSALFIYVHDISFYLPIFKRAIGQLLEQPNLSSQFVGALNELSLNIQTKIDDIILAGRLNKIISPFLPTNPLFYKYVLPIAYSLWSPNGLDMVACMVPQIVDTMSYAYDEITSKKKNINN